MYDGVGVVQVSLFWTVCSMLLGLRKDGSFGTPECICAICSTVYRISSTGSEDFFLSAAVRTSGKIGRFKRLFEKVSVLDYSLAGMRPNFSSRQAERFGYNGQKSDE